MSEAFIPPAPATPEHKVTIQGFGTGTVAEIEYHLGQLKEELEGTRRDLEAAQRELEHRPATVQGMIADMIDTRIEKALAARDEEVEEIVKSMDLFEGINFDSAVQGVVEAALADATVEVEVEARILT
tara:strand:- start:15 stop:398 length:384 start_codon:yes stop_codon:yes gene_type:complete